MSESPAQTRPRDTTSSHDSLHQKTLTACSKERYIILLCSWGPFSNGDFFSNCYIFKNRTTTAWRDCGAFSSTLKRALCSHATHAMPCSRGHGKLDTSRHACAALLINTRPQLTMILSLGFDLTPVPTGPDGLFACLCKSGCFQSCQDLAHEALQDGRLLWQIMPKQHTLEHLQLSGCQIQNFGRLDFSKKPRLGC